jgi:hypothetical protein
MNDERGKKPYGVVFFRPGVSPRAKKIKLFFFAAMSLIILAQGFYWLFANFAKPIIFGMPFSMFFIVALVAIQFVLLLLLYLFESKEMKD